MVESEVTQLKGGREALTSVPGRPLMIPHNNNRKATI